MASDAVTWSSDLKDRASAGVERSSGDEKDSVMMKESSVRTGDCRVRAMENTVPAMKCLSGFNFRCAKDLEEASGAEDERRRFDEEKGRSDEWASEISESSIAAKKSSSSPKVWASEAVEDSMGAVEQASAPDEETSEIVEHSGGLMEDDGVSMEAMRSGAARRARECPQRGHSAGWAGHLTYESRAGRSNFEDCLDVTAPGGLLVCFGIEVGGDPGVLPRRVLHAVPSSFGRG